MAAIIQGKFRYLLLTMLVLSLLSLVRCGGGGGSNEGGGGGVPPETGGTIELGWVSNNEPDLAGYRIHYGTSSGGYDHSIDVGRATQFGNLTTYSLANLVKGQNYCIVVTAYDTSNNESGFSEEICGAAW
jgi:hypothetical protein